MEQQTIKHVHTARILVLGDAGVGKSRLTDLLAKSEDTPTPATRRVGDCWWNVQVRLHEHPRYVWLPPTPEWTSSSSTSSPTGIEQFPRRGGVDLVPHFVEFYDLKSTLRMPREHRNRLYRHIDGIILVYDLLRMSTHDNLHDWLYQPLRQICRHRHNRMRPILKRRHVPILVVGTKLDLLTTRCLRGSGKIASQLGADEILVNCLDAKSFEHKSRNAGKLRKFLSNAIEFKLNFPTTGKRC
ncbi:rab-like protein 3 [Drosophila nasuta]|uniref:rab-like protein 3 n=1 Tax=Drosophila nasuta TaxID=42062 RepID=UPI00295F5550|nr:rab-like protein 3 [Drosophila nasuta]